MSSVSKSSAFPDTVQPGIPKLPEHPPAGWSRTKFGAHLFEEKRPVRILHDKSYDLVTVKRARGGVVRRDTKLGGDISVKTQFEVKAGDFLISKRQIVHGACGLVPDALDGSTVSNEYAVLRGKSTMDLGYLNHFSNSVFFQQTCFHSSIGVHIEKMIFKTDKWLDSRFDLPPINEQKRIAEILSTWDQVIVNTERLIANSRAQKKSLMQKLLTCEKRIQGFGEEWSTVTLEDVVEIDPEVLPSSTDPKYSFSYISLSEVEAGRILESIPTMSFESSPSRARKIVKRNDILMSTVRPNLLGFAKVNSSETDLVASTGFAVLRARKGISVDFVYHSLFGDFVTQQIDRLVAGSNYPAINPSDVKKLRIKIPKFEEQKQIAELLGAADSAVHVLCENVRCLRVEKNALMQQLFSGKRRVKVEEEAA